ncbi:MAG TPA: outer membrane lipoprotein chaperone LolA, partial [Usitatibacter sp.]|nr:outer membrane lipoprotein chaperone LolA [Usitatibacter sp.]
FQAYLRSTQSASADFDQKVFDKNGKLVQASRGSFVLQRPGKFRWTYSKPHPQVIVGDGERVWIHDPDLNQVTVKHVDAAISSTPASLLAGRDDITSLFTLRDAGTAGGIEWVEATPKAQDTGFERVRLGLAGKNLAAMELSDQLGGRTTLQFSDFKANVAIPADTFRFVPPKGADVLEDAPAKR